MKTAQRIKIIPMLLLLWALPMSMLPRVTAKTRATANSKTETAPGNEAQLKIAGDWNGDGIDTIGVFNESTGTMALNNTNSAGNGVGDIVFNFGQNGDIPLAGDWDGKPSLP